MKDKILAVDDEPTIRAIYAELFEDNFDFRVAESGDRALEIVKDFMPDIVILDIMMPGLSGFEVCETIRKNDDLSRVKVVLVSAEARLKERLKGYEMGADDYITKPFDADELVAKVNIFLKLKRREEVDTLKKNILSLLTHETNTPLNGILGFSQILSEETSLSDEQRSYAELINKSGHSLHSILTKVLLLCRLKEISYDLKVCSHSVNDLINESIEVNKTFAQEEKISLSFDSSNDVSVLINKELFLKALGYVIENAIKFSEVNSTVSIVVKTSNGICNIHVKDTGPGVSEDKMEFIFDEFAISRIENHSKGLGISLSLARRIALMHYGDLIVINNNYGGAKFSFTVPVIDN